MTQVALPDIPAESDLLCERCGYILKGLPGDGACPECGKPIVESDDPHLRGPAPIDDRTLSPARAWWATVVAVLLSPTGFFRHVETRREPDASRPFAMVNLLLFALTVAGFFVMHRVITFDALGIWANPLFQVVLFGVAKAGAFGLSFGLLNLAVWATGVEGRYRRMRLPARVVRRVLNLHTAHLLPVGLITLLTPGVWLVLDGVVELAWDWRRNYLIMIGLWIVVAGLWLFLTYWWAMRSVLFANR